MSTDALEMSAPRTWNIPHQAWLVLGVAITALVGNRYNIAPLAWVAAVPWLVYLRQLSGWRDHLLLLVCLQIG
jgi:hypothetical protein